MNRVHCNWFSTILAFHRAKDGSWISNLSKRVAQLLNSRQPGRLIVMLVIIFSCICACNLRHIIVHWLHNKNNVSFWCLVLLSYGKLMPRVKNSINFLLMCTSLINSFPIPKVARLHWLVLQWQTFTELTRAKEKRRNIICVLANCNFTTLV